MAVIEIENRRDNDDLDEEKHLRPQHSKMKDERCGAKEDNLIRIAGGVRAADQRL